jgi:O-antigen/teichoic acid export membrane protein
MGLWKKTAGYAVGRAAASSISLLVLPIITRLMSAEQFGLWQALAFWASLISVAVQLGTDQALFKFIFAKPAKKGEYLFISFATLFLSSGILLLAIIPFRSLIASAILPPATSDRLITLTVLWGITDALFINLASYFQSREKVLSFVITDLLRSVLMYGGAIYFLTESLGAASVIASSVAATTLVFLLFLPELVKRAHFPKNTESALEMFEYGLPLCLNMFIVKIYSLSDRWILGEIGDFGLSGEYSAAYKVAGIVGLIVVPIRYAWVAQMFSMHRDGTLKVRMFQIWRQLCGGVALLTVFTALFSGELFRILISPTYNGAVAVPILALSFLFDSLLLIGDIGIYVSGKTRIVPILTLFCAIINVVLNVVLIPLYGLVGSAIASASTFMIMAITGFIVGQKLYKVEVPYPKIALSLTCVGVAVAAAYTVETLIGRLVCAVVLGCVIVFGNGLHGDLLAFARDNDFLKNK